MCEDYLTEDREVTVYEDFRRKIVDPNSGEDAKGQGF